MKSWTVTSLIFLLSLFPMASRADMTRNEAIQLARAAVPEAVSKGTAIRHTRGAAQKELSIPDRGVKERCEESGDHYIVSFDTEQSGTLNGSVLARVTINRITGAVVEVVTYY
jgi:hypothetical protein